jgi:hypothetical protein
MPICVQNCRLKLGLTGYYGADIVENQLLKVHIGNPGEIDGQG